MVFVGGQNGTGTDGNLVGDDIGKQTEQALKNVLEVLKAAGASQKDVVKMTIYVAKGQDINAGFAASQKAWGMHPTTISVLTVEAPARPARWWRSTRWLRWARRSLGIANSMENK